MKKNYLFFLFLAGFVNAQDIKQDTIELNETVLYDKSKFRVKRLGADTKTKTILIGLDADTNFTQDSAVKFIKEIAIPINAPKKEFTFQQINFNFSHPIKEDSVILKVDFSRNLRGLPEKSILEKPFEVVVKKEAQHDNIFTMDLRDYRIKYEDDFFIKVELLTEVERPVYFSSSLLAKCLYRREKSAQWQKTPLGATPAINVDILIKR